MDIMIPGSVAVAAAVLFIMVIYLRGKKSRTGKKILSEMLAESDEATQLMRDLRVKCMQNEETVNRLINAEKERKPDGSELDWVRAAISRWERDNR